MITTQRIATPTFVPYTVYRDGKEPVIVFPNRTTGITDSVAMHIVGLGFEDAAGLLGAFDSNLNRVMKQNNVIESVYRPEDASSDDKLFYDKKSDTFISPEIQLKNGKALVLIELEAIETGGLLVKVYIKARGEKSKELIEEIDKLFLEKLDHATKPLLDSRDAHKLEMWLRGREDSPALKNFSGVSQI